MASDEAAWLHLYEQARSAFDDAAADELMNALERNPATKDDIVRLDARIDVLEANLRAEITAANSELLRTLFFLAERLDTVALTADRTWGASSRVQQIR